MLNWKLVGYTLQNMGNSVRALFGVIVSVGIIMCLLVGMLANSAARTAIPALTVPSTERVKTWRFNGKGRHHFHRDMDLYYVSKRKVPNGPDPIHNRRAETSRRPPGA